MIVAEQKPLEEIKDMIAGAEKVLILGCGTCVTVCFAGGEKEVSILASQLRMATRLEGQEKEIREEARPAVGVTHSKRTKQPFGGLQPSEVETDGLQYLQVIDVTNIPLESLISSVRSL